jgi:hypothetical protein
MLIQRQADPYTPEYYNEYSGDTLQNIAIIFIALNTFFVLLRCYARYLTKTTIGWDDYFYVAGYIFNIGSCVTAICAYTSLCLIFASWLGTDILS